MKITGKKCFVSEFILVITESMNKAKILLSYG